MDSEQLKHEEELVKEADLLDSAGQFEKATRIMIRRFRLILMMQMSGSIKERH